MTDPHYPDDIRPDDKHPDDKHPNDKRPDTSPPDGVLATPPRSLDARDRQGAERKPRPSVLRSRPSGRRRPRGTVVLVILGLILIPGVWWFLNRDLEPTLPVDFGGGADLAPETTAIAGDRAVVLVFPEWDASGFVTEQRQISSRDRPGEDLHGVMEGLCAGPSISGAISALPQGTRALAAFVNPDDQSVVLDFSEELVTRHPGGSAAEVATLTSILRTVALNFPGTRSCVILVEGAQVETVAGHLDLVHSFDPRRWL